MATINVTKEKCERCIYGYPCTMWNELSLPMEGERCDNYEEHFDNGSDKELHLHELNLL